MKIIRARLKPMGKATEFLSIQGRIKSLIDNHPDENFDFVMEEDNGSKSVKNFGVDNINKELVGKTIQIIDSSLSAKFNKNGTISIVEPKTRAKKVLPEKKVAKKPIKKTKKNENKIHRFDEFEVSESLPRKSTVDQLKKLRNLTKGTDIGDKVSVKNAGNLIWDKNPTSSIESYEDFEDSNKKFVTSWNLKGLKGPFNK